ncbi:hypothetical protein EON66_10095, partial [archaeon]
MCAVWNNVYGYDMTCIKRMAMLEPLVDTVNGDALVSNAVPFLVRRALLTTPCELRFPRDETRTRGSHSRTHTRTHTHNELSTPPTLQTIDIMKVKKEELAFATPFKITFDKEDYCHALVAYFDIEFSFCHKPVRFSTGPQAKYTHWKQTVFYLEDILPVDVGDSLEGFIRCRPNARNHR